MLFTIAKDCESTLRVIVEANPNQGGPRRWMTDYPLGLFRFYSFRMHGLLDYGVALARGMMPEIARMEDGASSRFFRCEGSGETAIAAMTKLSGVMLVLVLADVFLTVL